LLEPKMRPGSVGPRRFSLPIVLGVIDVSQEGVSVRHIDCVTGLVWKPARPEGDHEALRKVVT
jgi:hypothetical protein